jgi:hypothetical protein
MLVIKQRGASRTPDKCASALGPLVKRSAGTPRTPVLPAWLETVARIFAVLGAGVCLYAMRQADPDLWGYLAYGRLFVEQGALLTHDPFAYTSAPFQWVTFEYGAHLLLWWAFHYGGALGLIGLKCLLGGTALWCLYAAIRATSDESFVWVPAFLLAASTVSRYFVFRPQLFTFAFFALFVAVLIRYLLRRAAPLWLLPIVMVAWVNVHGGFVAGLGAVGLTVLLRVSETVACHGWRIRRLVEGSGPLSITLAACALVTCINPQGLTLWSYVLTELTHGTNRQYIAEWRPPSLSNDPWSLIVLTLIAAMLLVVGIVAHRRRIVAGPAVAFWVASCLPLIAMSYLSVRHVPLAAIWATPVITLLGTRLQVDLPELATFRRIWFLLRGFALLPVCLTLSVVYSAPQPVIRTLDAAVLGSTNPCRAVNFLRENHVEGNLYNPLWWGSYITWELYPQIRVSMDGRNISLFPGEMVLENLTFYSNDPSEADLDAPLRHGTDLLLVPSDLPVLTRVHSDGRWRQVYADRDAVIFVRADAAAGSRAAALSGRKFAPPSGACSPTLE